MIIAAIILGIIIIGLIVLISHLNQGDGAFDIGMFFGIWLIICVVIEIGMIIDITEEPHPTPMDVYRGKTTLEYTIRDGVKIDSVVVWKDNAYGNKD